MPLAAGSRLGPYEIIEPLGAGGMGEVYRARDPRLGREVAIKIVATASGDPDRLARFEQEARAAAALNHPHILAVFDIGSAPGEAGLQAGPAPYIVSELLEGETLRERLARGALGPRKSVEYATQIASGLAAAHDRGIVHRDLKPENIVVAGAGHVKILDFGLAKLMAAPADAGPHDRSVRLQPDQSLLLTAAPETTPGTILGTVGYMAPEQVKGLAADHRSDIFAFGAVLYEMVSGRRAFQRDTPPETMTAILKEEPPELASSVQGVPLALDRIIRRCLEKNPAARFHSAHDLAFALEALDTTSSMTSAALPAASRPGRTAERLGWGAAAVMLAAAAAFATLRLAPAPSPAPLVTFTLLPSFQTPFMGPVVSPDGRSVAYVALGPRLQLVTYVRPLGSIESRVIPGTEAVSAIWWSPDSRSVAVVAEGKLKRVDVDGRSAPLVLADAEGDFGGTWNRDGVMLFGSREGIKRMSANGGTPTLATRVAGAEAIHSRPVFLPDQRRFIYGVTSAPARQTGAVVRQMYVGSLDSDERTPLPIASDSSNVAYADGHLLYLRGRSLVAHPFDAAGLTFTGDAVVVGSDVASQPNGRFAFFSAAGGVLAYQVAAPPGANELTWFDRAGRKLAVVGEMRSYQNVELTRDGRRIAVGVLDEEKGTRDIWTGDVARGLLTRFTFDAAEERSPIWSPDGSRVVFNSNRTANLELYIKPASGAGGEELLLRDNRSKDPMSWSADGRHVLFRHSGAITGNDVWVLAMDGERKATPLLQSPFDENYARFSPDGRWIAYTSDESGRAEVYVTAFPGGGKWQVSSAGGVFPRWRGDGREIYFIGADRVLAAVPVNGTGAGLDVGRAERLFEPRLSAQPGYPYAVTADGQRFLVNVDHAPSVPLTVVVNWTALLKD